VFRTIYSDSSYRERQYAAAVTTLIDEENSRKTVEVDAFGRTKTEIAYNGATSYQTASYAYDGKGRLRTVLLNNTLLKALWYDALGRKTRQYDANSGFWDYGYDANGNLRWQEDPEPNQHIQICYDEINRPVMRCPIANAFTGTLAGCEVCGSEGEVLYTYDEALEGGSNALGRLTSAEDESGMTEFKMYDERGRLRKVRKTITVGPGTYYANFEYTYDGNDRVTLVRYPDGEEVETEYDDSGQPVALSNPTQLYVVDAEYDRFGRLKFITHGNGVKDTLGYAPASARHRLNAVGSVDEDSAGGPTTGQRLSRHLRRSVPFRDVHVRSLGAPDDLCRRCIALAHVRIRRAGQRDACREGQRGGLVSRLRRPVEAASGDGRAHRIGDQYRRLFR
jgi:YD repeat-containing protein